MNDPVISDSALAAIGAAIARSDNIYLKWLAPRLASPLNVGRKCICGRQHHPVSDAMVECAINGNLCRMKYMWRVTKTFTANAVIAAAEHNQLHILKWMKKKHYKWTQAVVNQAIIAGNLRVVKWLYKTTKTCMKTHDGRCMHRTRRQYVFGHAMSKAIDNGHLDILKWLDSVGFELFPTAIQRSIGAGSMDVVNWLYHIKKVPLNEYCYYTAARVGRNDMLEWLHVVDEYYCKGYMYGATRYASIHGHIHTLEWFIKRGCKLGTGVWTWRQRGNEKLEQFLMEHIPA